MAGVVRPCTEQRERGPRRSARRIRWCVGVLLCLGAVAGAEVIAGGPCWRPPVDGVVVEPFGAPECRYCPGRRGVEYRVAAAAPVRAVAAGVVTFSGEVAGIRYVVVALPSGWRITYGRLASSAVDTGDRMLAGSQIATASGRFYFGVRVGDDDYVDPAPMLGTVVGAARLVPIDGTAPRPPVRTRVVCEPGPSPVASPGSIRPGPTAVRSDVTPVSWSTTRSLRRRPRDRQPRRGEQHGRHHHAPDARGRSPLRSPDPTLEPEDEALHLR